MANGGADEDSSIKILLGRGLDLGGGLYVDSIERDTVRTEGCMIRGDQV